MAYDSLTTDQLLGMVFDKFDVAENGIQAAMRYIAEVRTRLAAPPEPEEPAPPTPVPVHPQPAPGEPITGWVRADTVKPHSRFTPEQLRTMLRAIKPSVDNGGDPNGAFRLNDHAVKGGLIDPFFRFGQERAGHHHTFFGNPLIGAHSTYEQLRREGVASSHAGAMDGGAIWVPTIFARHTASGEWRAVTDLRLIRYYKATPDIEHWDAIASGSPAFAAWVAGLHPQNREWYAFHRLVELPHGLRFIAGVTNGTAKFGFGADGLLTVQVESSPLWDGKHIDAPDHISHMAVAKRDRNYRLVVNPDYPKRLTVITMKFGVMSWPEGVDPATARVSSDIQHYAKPFDTLHAEYVEGWEPAVKTMWHDAAINRHLNCSSANLGNGLACVAGPNPDPATFGGRFSDLTVPFV